MSLDNFKNRTIIWDTVNKDFPQPIQIMQGDVNARTLLIKIVDNGTEIDLTGHSLKLTYQYTNSSNSGFVMIPPKDLAKGEFILVIPTEMTTTGVIEANLILLNESLEQVIVSKSLTFISDSSTVSDLAQEINNNIDDFTKLLLERMPQVLRSELNDLHAQTESNKSNIDLKANLADMTSLQSAMTELKNEVEAFGISPENLVTIKSLLDAIASNASEAEVVELINSVKILTSNISLMSNGDYSPKANQTDLESLQHTVNDHSATISAKANQTDLDNLQAKVSQTESEAKNAMAKAAEAQANSLPLNGIAVSASKLATPRKLGVNLQTSAFPTFDGTADVTNIGIQGTLPIANGGTGNVLGYTYGLNCNTNTTDFSSGMKVYTRAVNTNQANMFILQSVWAKNAPAVGVYIVICSVTNYSANGNMSMTALANGTIYTATVPYIYTEPTTTTQAIYTTTATPNWVKILNENGNAASSSKLATPRKLGVNLQSSSFPTFDGSSDVTDIGVTGVLPIANGGTSTADGVINTIAYANSADGKDGFTTVYPNLNLLDGTKDFSGNWDNASAWVTDGTYKGLVVKKRTGQWQGIYKKFTAPKDGKYTFSAYIKSSGGATITGVVYINDSELKTMKVLDNDFDWKRDEITVDLKAGDVTFGKYEITAGTTSSVFRIAGHKWEEGSTATPYMPSAREVTVADYPKYVGFSNSIKPNKKSSDYTWLPMGLVSIDRATGLLKPAVIGIDCAQAHPVGSVVTNNSNLSSGYSTGKWDNIGSAVIGSTTIYYWKRTA